MLTISVIGAAIGQLTFCFCTSAFTFILARAMTGCFSGGHVINSMSYFAEIGGLEKRNRNLAVHVVSSTMFMAMGYLVGGLLGNISFYLTFGVQVGILLICGATLLPLVGESPGYPAEKEAAATATPSISLRRVLTPLLLLSLLLTVAVTIGTNLFDEAFNYYLSKNLFFLPSQIGAVRAGVGLLGLSGYFLICRPLLKSNFLRQAQAATYTGCILSLVLVITSQSLPSFLSGAMIYFFCNSVANSLLQVSVVGSTRPENLGTVAGIFQSSKTLGSVIGSLASGFAYTFSPRFPFLLSVFVFVASLILVTASIWLAKRNLNINFI
ncbi:MFS transporter [Bacteroidia bacterium]|nr:MFS transporter [Bacteroidia bacterium]